LAQGQELLEAAELRAAVEQAQRSLKIRSPAGAQPDWRPQDFVVRVLRSR